jgi:hypothetical protein
LEYLSPLGKILCGIHLIVTSVAWLAFYYVVSTGGFEELLNHPMPLALLLILSLFAYLILKSFFLHFFPQYQRRKLQKLFRNYFEAPANIYIKAYADSEFGVRWFWTEIGYPKVISLQEFQAIQTLAKNLGISKDSISIGSQSVRQKAFIAHLIQKPDPYKDMSNAEKAIAINDAVTKEIQESSVITFRISANELLKRLKQTSR